MKKNGFICFQNGIEEIDLDSNEQGSRLMELFLNKRQLDAIEHLKKTGSITSLEYREMFKVAPETAIKELLQLVDEGMVKEQSKLKFVKV